jgi:osmotically-inducible protein OsmY
MKMEMKMQIKSLGERPRLLWFVGILVFFGLLATSVGIGYLAASQAPIENRQELSSADSHISQRIRSSMRSYKSLSSLARNVKIISQGGKVTLRGLVQSEREKDTFQAEAVAVVGDSNVSNQLEIALSR